jgi:hypothetical protein
MIKKSLYFILFINSVLCYKFNFIKYTPKKYNKPLITRRKLFSISPFLLSLVSNDDDKTIQDLRKEANRIIDIIEAQKETFNLPELDTKTKNRDDNNKDNKDNNDNKDKDTMQIENTLKDIMSSFKKDTPNEALTKLKSYSSDMNTIKQTSNERLISLFNDSKYGILFNKFKDYEIINYETYNEETDKFYNVDMKIYATYKNLLYNGVQFNDIYYPENTNLNLNNDENICYVIYKWNFIKKNNKYELVSCYLESKI